MCVCVCGAPRTPEPQIPDFKICVYMQIPDTKAWMCVPIPRDRGAVRHSRTRKYQSKNLFFFKISEDFFFVHSPARPPIHLITMTYFYSCLLYFLAAYVKFLAAFDLLFVGLLGRRAPPINLTTITYVSSYFLYFLAACRLRSLFGGVASAFTSCRPSWPQSPSPKRSIVLRACCFPTVCVSVRERLTKKKCTSGKTKFRIL